MNTFNTTIRVSLAKRVMILIYVVALSCMMFGLSWSFAQQNAKADTSTTYDSVRPTVAVVDRGTDGAGFSTSLQTFLAHDCDMVHVGSSDEDLQHAVASNYVDLLVMVPDGYVQHMAQALQDGRPLPELDVVMFTSGMAFPVSMMPAAMIAIGKFTPGWWFYQSIEALNGTGGSYSLAGWAANLALVALSGATFICLGLAVSRIRRARPSSQGSAVTQPAGN